MIEQGLKQVLESIPVGVKLVAVSKTKPVSDIKTLYDFGHRCFGENKVQELVAKHEQLPKDIEWHMIGHLQSNKVKYLAPFIQLIHAVDSIKLLKEINKQAQKYNRVIDVLLQFHIAKEESKFGLKKEQVREIMNEYKSINSVRIKGVMGMASFVENQFVIRDEFKALKKIFDELKLNYFSQESSFNTLSMGMSGDYHIAIEEGSNMIRVGSSIFGKRV